MNNERHFDCVKFKNELQEKLIKNSEAKNLTEYVKYVNKVASSSSLHKSFIKSHVKRTQVTPPNHHLQTS